jgi:hypothetical protein
MDTPVLSFHSLGHILPSNFRQEVLTHAQQHVLVLAGRQQP